jgi:hypothetical protein
MASNRLRHDQGRRKRMRAQRFFAEYLSLLAAHRWLCTAEAYDYEERPEGAARSRQAYRQAISTARKSTDLLIRSAAQALGARRRCFSDR